MIKLLVAPTGSGKSTYAKNCAKLGDIICNDDKIVSMLHGGNYLLYNKEYKRLYKSIEMAIITHAVCLGKNVVIDKTSLTKESRAKYISLAHSLGERIVAVVFPIETPEVHAERRFMHNPRGHKYEKWLEVARHHIGILEKPSLKEGLDEIIKFKWTNGQG